MDITANRAGGPKLMVQLRGALRRHHLSPRTMQAYTSWARRFIFFHHVRHPALMGEPEVLAFLTHLAEARQASHSTQMQASSALLFLYREVVGKPLDGIRLAIRAHGPSRLPVVLTPEEAAQVLDRLYGVTWLVATLLYGSGLRLMEALTLRVKDIDFGLARDSDPAPQGRERLGDRAATSGAGADGPASGTRPRAAPERPGPGSGGSRVAGGNGGQGSHPGEGLGLAMGVSGAAPLPRRCDGRTAAASSGSVDGPAGGAAGGPSVRHPQAGYLSHLSAQLRNPPAGERV
jgi:hypothetical protein